MSDGDILSFTDPGNIRERTDEFADSAGYDSRNKALQDLVRTGLRENQSPILTRWRERAIEWAGLLSLFAMVFVAGGVVTPLAMSWTLQMAGVLLVFAATLTAIVEIARIASGQSELRQQLSEVVA